MTRRRFQVPALLRAIEGLDAWWLATAGVEANRVVTVHRTKWTVCFKLHLVRGQEVEYHASITLWPTARQKLASRRQLGWQPDLVRSNWYRACRRELGRHGYHGSWHWSPRGRYGDFWRRLPDSRALAKEVRLLEELRRARPFFASPRRRAEPMTCAF